MNADIWINEQHLGNHPYGYTSFSYDITDFIRFDKENLIAIEVKNDGENSRWYSGSGIYRHVWLKATNPIHVADWGVSISTPELSAMESKVRVITEVRNELKNKTKIKLLTRIIDSYGNEKAKFETKSEINANSEGELNQEMIINSPELWSIESPVLYKAITEVYSCSNLTDKTETSFGIRSISFDIEKGFQINGKTVLLKGGCVHHDKRLLGSAAYDRAEERRVELLKASGFNAIRCAHNPPSPAFLDACDRLGMMVIDESFDMWKDGKNPQDFHLYFKDWWKQDIESMVLRDRNHPSIIMWSIGNEIPGMEKTEVVEVAKMVGDYVRSLDSARPVTAAVNGLSPNKDAYFATLDIAGYNYSFGGDHGRKSIFEIDHERIPDRIMYCSESYPLEAFGAWMNVLDYPYVFGDFVWTGFDYLGEASIGYLGYLHRTSFYPWNHAFCGDIDICGFKRPQSYYRDVLWEHEDGFPVSIFVKPPAPSFEMIPGKENWSKWNWHDLIADWNWKGYEGKDFEVMVYCMYPELELFLNGMSLGKKNPNRDNRWISTFQVPYEEGELTAVAYIEGTEKSRLVLATSDEPMQIRLTADRIAIEANGQDLSYITVELLDNNNIRNPKADQLIHFEIEGNGKIIATGSSNPMSTESYQLPKRKAYQGRCVVVVKSGKNPGTIKLKASSNGVEPAEIIIKVN